MIIIQGNKAKYWLGILASIFLGMTFVVAGTSKVFIPSGNIELSAIFIALLGGAEFTVGALLVAGIYVKAATTGSLFLIAGFITSNILAKVLGQEECLSCFGAMGKLSISSALYLDGIMVALVVVILCWYPARFFEARPWFWRK